MKEMLMLLAATISKDECINQLQEALDAYKEAKLLNNEEDLEDYDLEGNFIRLEVKDISSSSMLEVRKNLLENKKVATMEIKQVAKKEEHVITDAKAILLKEDEMIEKYVNQVNVDLDKDRLIKVGKIILEK